MPDPNLVRINSIPYSWNSCAHFFSGFPYKGLTEVSFRETREVSLVHAAQQDGVPLGQTAGIYKVEDLSFTMLQDSAFGLMADLTLLGLGSFGDASFSYVLQTFEPAIPPSPPLTSVISGCRITGVEEKYDVKSDANVIVLKCSALFVVRSFAGLPMSLQSQLRKLLP